MSTGRQEDEQAVEHYRLNFVQVVNEGDDTFWQTVWIHCHNEKPILKVVLCTTLDAPKIYFTNVEGDEERRQHQLDASDLILRSLPSLTRGSPSFSLDIPVRAVEMCCGPSFSDPEWMSSFDRWRAIAGRMGDGCDINLHIGTVPQGEPQTFRATRTGYDDKTGTYTFTIAEGEATDENEPA